MPYRDRTVVESTLPIHLVTAVLLIGVVTSTFDRIPVGPCTLEDRTVVELPYSRVTNEDSPSHCCVGIFSSQCLIPIVENVRA